MSRQDDSLSRYMLGTMGGGNGGLHAAYGQMHAMLAAEDRRMAERAKPPRPAAPRRPPTPDEAARQRKALGWLALYAIVMAARPSRRRRALGGHPDDALGRAFLGGLAAIGRSIWRRLGRIA